MNPVDIILLVLLIPAVISGIRKGFITQLTSLLAILVGIWLSFRFSSAVTAWLQPYLHLSEQWLRLISFLIILVVVGVALNLVGKALEKVVKLALLGWLNKLLGVALSLLKALVVIGLLILIFDSLNLKFAFVPQETLNSSVLYAPVRDGVYAAFPYFRQLIAKQ